MTNRRILVFLSLILIATSCSSIKLESRIGLDIQLNANSFDKLNGDYKNSNQDTSKSNKSLYNNFNYDSIYKQKHLIVNFTSIDKHKIKIKVLDKETVIDSLTLKGKYRRGYFKIKRQWSTSFLAGPLLWMLAEDLKYLGLTKENKLVIIDSGGGGVMLFIAFPIFAAGHGQFENVYEQAK